MKTGFPTLETHFQDQSTTTAVALKITRPDGYALALTTHDVSDPIGGTLYLSDPGLLVTNIVLQANAAVGNFELTTLHDDTIFKVQDILNGLWTNSEFEVFRYNYKNLTGGIVYLLAGTVGEAVINLNHLVIELRDLRQYLQQSVGALTSKNCRDRLGGPNCKVRVNPPVWQASHAYTVRPPGDAAKGSVIKPTILNNRHYKCSVAGTSGALEPVWNTGLGSTTVDGSVTWIAIQALTVRGAITSRTSNQVFRDNLRTEPIRFFGEGEFKFLTGNNAGARRKVRAYAADGSFFIATPFYGTVAVADQYEVTAGCHKRLEEDCVPQFDNNLNHDAEPHKTGIDGATSAPGGITAVADATEGFA